MKNLSMVEVVIPEEVPATRGRLLGEGGGVRSGRDAVSSVLVRTCEVDEEERGLWRIATEEEREIPDGGATSSISVSPDKGGRGVGRRRGGVPQDWGPVGRRATLCDTGGESGGEAAGTGLGGVGGELEKVGLEERWEGEGGGGLDSSCEGETGDLRNLPSMSCGETERKDTPAWMPFSPRAGEERGSSGSPRKKQAVEW
jgi:hypothetical protein